MKNLLRALPLLALLGCPMLFADTPAADQPVDATPAPAATSTSAPVHTCAEVKDFKDQLHKAINDALKYPHAVAQHPVVGVTNVEYEYYDGKVQNVRVTMASGDAMLDRSALNAVKDADYATISPRIDDEVIHDLVIIVFDNTGEMDSHTKKDAKKKQAAAEDCGKP